MTMGDRVCVLKDGLLMQVGTPRELYDHPDNIFVAGFIGSPAMNLLELPVADGGVKLGDTVYPVERSVLSGAGNHVTVGVRPEDLTLSERGLAVQVDVVEELGADAYIYGRAVRSGPGDADVHAAPGSTSDLGGELQIIARTDGRRPPQKGSTIHFVPEQGHVHLFDSESGQRLGS
jgi:multiple sugar transport system ATP-binding protein